MRNKTGRYFKYAIGEIVLVVIGILIALQINNWNEVKKTKEKEEHALNEIISDLENNIKNLTDIKTREINGLNSSKKSLKVIIDVLENNKQYHDSLIIHFTSILGYPDPDIKTSGYESLTSIGMDLISENQLRSEIGMYYTSKLPDLDRAYNELRDDFYHYILDYSRFLFKGGHYNKTYNRNIMIPIDFEKLKDNRGFIESIKIYATVYNGFDTMTVESIESAKTLKQNIELTLEKKLR
ncbi:DUF6090 family protein [Winogradskyella sp. A3E31]|uniref:DUF6090 family protein n=1 Tax=Winogradskyella sp. A3E31 TaxID=3349637 RepID=UPI00398A7F9F